MSAKLDRLRHAAAAPLHHDVSIDEHRAAILQLGASRAGKTTDDDEKNKTCPKCKEPVSESDNYCSHCGKGLGEDSTGNGEDDARERAKHSARTRAAQSKILAKIEAQTKLLETQISEQAQDGLGLFSDRELAVYGLVPESTAIVEFEGREALGLPSPAEAQALLKGMR